MRCSTRFTFWAGWGVTAPGRLQDLGRAMARGKVHTTETKAAVLAALMAGQSISEVARDYKIPSGTIKGWKADTKRFSQPVEPEKKIEIGDLLLEYLRENLVTLKEQSIHARKAEWLDRQSAADLAVLHGVSVDKAVRLLEALAGYESADGA